MKSMSTDLASPKLTSIACGDMYLAGLRSDGTVVSAGKFGVRGEFYEDYEWSHMSHADKWAKITRIDAGGNFVIGLKSDGTVLYDGDLGLVYREVQQWTNIVSVSACYQNVIGLKADGTAICTTYNRNLLVRNWNDIVSVYGGWNCAFGLRSDGTVVATGKNQYKRFNIEKWRNIIEVASGYSFTAGLKSDGTVIIAGYLDEAAKSEVNSWKGIKSISISNDMGDNLYGIKNDGTVVRSPSPNNSYTNYIRRSTDQWRDIVEVKENTHFTIGLTSEGRILYADHDIDSNREYHAFFNHETLENFR